MPLTGRDSQFSVPALPSVPGLCRRLRMLGKKREIERHAIRISARMRSVAGLVGQNRRDADRDELVVFVLAVELRGPSRIARRRAVQTEWSRLRWQ